VYEFQLTFCSSVLRSEALVDAGQRKSDELRLKGALAELRGFVRVVLPKIQDRELISEAEKVLEKANEAAEKAIG